VHRDVPESDWKVFRELREVALQRFCERVLEEVVRITRDSSRSSHERYLELFRLLQRRDDQLGDAFNDPARSRMIVQLATIQMLDLLVPGELGRFSQETRSRIEPLTGCK
jgi:hypothetical protein